MNQLIGLSQSGYGRLTKGEPKIHKTGTASVIFDTGDDT